MNQILFFLHILAVLGFLWFAVRLGKSALTAFIALCGVLANLFVVKQIELFTLQVTCSDVFAIGGILGLNLLQELYGRSSAKRASGTALLALVFFACMAQIHLLYTPSHFDQTQGSFFSILSSSPRIIAASCFVYYLVQRLDIVWFALLKKFLPFLALRIFISLILSQALDTVLFSFLGLYGIVSSLFDIIIMSFAVKCTVIACSSPIASLLKRAHREAA